MPNIISKDPISKFESAEFTKENIMSFINDLPEDERMQLGIDVSVDLSKAERKVKYIIAALARDAQSRMNGHEYGKWFKEFNDQVKKHTPYDFKINTVSIWIVMLDNFTAHDFIDHGPTKLRYGISGKFSIQLCRKMLNADASYTDFKTMDQKIRGGILDAEGNPVKKRDCNHASLDATQDDDSRDCNHASLDAPGENPSCNTATPDTKASTATIDNTSGEVMHEATVGQETAREEERPLPVQDQQTQQEEPVVAVQVLLEHIFSEENLPLIDENADTRLFNYDKAFWKGQSERLHTMLGNEVISRMRAQEHAIELIAVAKSAREEAAEANKKYANRQFAIEQIKAKSEELQNKVNYYESTIKNIDEELLLDRV